MLFEKNWRFYPSLKHPNLIEFAPNENMTEIRPQREILRNIYFQISGLLLVEI